jgi:hypothetical protein
LFSDFILLNSFSTLGLGALNGAVPSQEIRFVDPMSFRPKCQGKTKSGACHSGEFGVIDTNFGGIHVEVIILPRRVQLLLRNYV